MCFWRLLAVARSSAPPGRATPTTSAAISNPTAMKRGLGTSRLRRGTRIEKTAGTPGIGGLGRWQRTIAQPHLGVRTAIAAASTKMANPRVSTSLAAGSERLAVVTRGPCRTDHLGRPARQWLRLAMAPPELMQQDRKSTRLNSSHTVISYAVFCLKKKKKKKGKNKKLKKKKKKKKKQNK